VHYNGSLIFALFVLTFTVCFWTVRLRDIIEGLFRVPTLDPRSKVDLPTDPPLISVIVPAHNEQKVIRECINSVLRQDYPKFELILVDDRSSDGTLSVAKSLCEGKENCKIISVKKLPQGWTGKCHALDVAVRYASGAWLAFLDADSALEKSTLSICYSEAVKRSVNMLTLTPLIDMRTIWDKVLQPTFAAMICIILPLNKVNDPASPIASANGMFFMISKYAYRRIGGHRDVRDLAVEDIGIGKRVKALGLGLLFANGRKLLRTRMYNGFFETLKGWTRILSGSMNYEVRSILKYLATHIVISLPVFLAALYLYISPAMELWPESWYYLPILCGIEMSIVPAIFVYQMGLPPKYSILAIVGQFILIWVFAVILKKVLCKDALQWRGTTYAACRYEPRRLDPLSTNIELR
jgi:chlorobactene glucosyltransferase